MNAVILTSKTHESTFASVVIPTTNLKQSNKKTVQIQALDVASFFRHTDASYLSSWKGPVGFPGDPGPPGEPGVAVSMK